MPLEAEEHLVFSFPPAIQISSVTYYWLNPDRPFVKGGRKVQPAGLSSPYSEASDRRTMNESETKQTQTDTAMSAPFIKYNYLFSPVNWMLSYIMRYMSYVRRYVSRKIYFPNIFSIQMQVAYYFDYNDFKILGKSSFLSLFVFIIFWLVSNTCSFI